VPNGKSVIIIVTVNTANMVNANTPYLASLVLSYYRGATGGSVIDADAIDVTVNITPSVPAITLTGSLSYSAVVGDTSAAAKVMTIENTGQDPSVLTWAGAFTLDAGIAGKFSLDVSSGTLNHGATQNVNVTFNPTGVVAGTYAGSVDVSETVVGGVTPQSSVIAVVMAPWYNDVVKAIQNGSNATFTSFSGDRSWSINLGGSARLFLNILPNGAGGTFQYRNSLGVSGPTAAIQGLTFRASDGYPSCTATPVFYPGAGGGWWNVIIGPSVW
jgi:hypothetical protein